MMATIRRPGGRSPPWSEGSSSIRRGSERRAQPRRRARPERSHRVFIDDDVDAPAGWLDRLLAGVRIGARLRGVRRPDRRAPGGRRAARLRTRAAADHDARSRDPGLRRAAGVGGQHGDTPRALERVGGFDERISRPRRRGGMGAALHAPAAGAFGIWPARASSIARAAADRGCACRAAAFHHGRAARRNDVRKRAAPPLRRELRVLAGCAWHTVRRRCGNGIVMGAHAAGRIRQALTERRS